MLRVLTIYVMKGKKHPFLMQNNRFTVHFQNPVLCKLFIFSDIQKHQKTSIFPTKSQLDWKKCPYFGT